MKFLSWQDSYFQARQTLQKNRSIIFRASSDGWPDPQFLDECRLESGPVCKGFFNLKPRRVLLDTHRI
jgi:hypothetical protein